MITAILLVVSCGSFAQNIDSAKVKKQPFSTVDSGLNKFYAQLPPPRHSKRMIIPALQDSDGDGIPNQLDLEPNTPRGAEVDSHGRAIDTDGDGVPDYRDKEKLTPQRCFPVDSEGVGRCPEAGCCAEVKRRIDSIKNEEIEYFCCGSVHCDIDSLPPVKFKINSAHLTREATVLLSSVAEEVKKYPYCNVKVIGYAESTYFGQQLSWDRVNAVIKYLVEKQDIMEERLIFSYDNKALAKTRGIDSCLIDLIPTMETGPNYEPPPAPNFRKFQQKN